MQLRQLGTVPVASSRLLSTAEVHICDTSRNWFVRKNEFFNSIEGLRNAFGSGFQLPEAPLREHLPAHVGGTSGEPAHRFAHCAFGAVQYMILVDYTMLGCRSYRANSKYASSERMLYSR